MFELSKILQRYKDLETKETKQKVFITCLFLFTKTTLFKFSHYIVLIVYQFIILV